MTSSTTFGASGSAFSQTPVHVATGFSTVFQFQITDPGGIGAADGLVFVAQNVGSSLGGAGGGIGYAGVGHSIGVELDTFFNGGVDISGNELAIDDNGDINHFDAGNGPVLTLPTSLDDGNVWTAWIDYDPNLHILSASANETGVKPLVPMISQTINLLDAANIGQPDAFVGFTGGTGAGSENGDILNWTYFDHFNPTDTSTPAPAAVWGTMVLLAGFGALRFCRRRAVG